MHEGGALDLPALGARSIDWHVAEGTAGIVIVGTTGESPTVDHDEHCLLISTAVEHARQARAGDRRHRRQLDARGDRATPTTRSPSAPTCRLSVVPYYNKPTQEGLYRHFRTIAEKVDLPMILYNVPGRTVADLATTPCCGSPKCPASSGSRTRPSDLGRGTSTCSGACPPTTALRCTAATTITALPLMLLGGHGVISVTANVAPRLMSDMCRAALAGDYALPRAHQRPPDAAATPSCSSRPTRSRQVGAGRDGPDRRTSCGCR